MIGKKLRDAMNEQIKNELESYYIYLSMAAWFHEENLDGMAHWMRCQAHEEMIHAMKLFDHILERGGKVKLLNLKQIKTDWSSPLQAFKDADNHEKFISGKIKDLTKICRQTSEYPSEPTLAWFNGEQIEEESTTGKIVADLTRVGKSKEGLLLIDRELAGRAYPAGSPFDPVAYSSAT
jgi:ferritin